MPFSGSLMQCSQLWFLNSLARAETLLWWKQVFAGLSIYEKWLLGSASIALQKWKTLQVCHVKAQLRHLRVCCCKSCGEGQVCTHLAITHATWDPYPSFWRHLSSGAMLAPCSEEDYLDLGLVHPIFDIKLQSDVVFGVWWRTGAYSLCELYQWTSIWP